MEIFESTAASKLPNRSATLRETERELILRAMNGTEWVIGGPRGSAVGLCLTSTSMIYKVRKLDNSGQCDLCIVYAISWTQFLRLGVVVGL